MRKFVTIVLVLMLVVLCTACSGDNNKNDSSSDSSDAQTADNASETQDAGNAASVAVGNIIRFGSYEQDNNLDNGPEPIEWIVLDVQEDKALLLSKYGLDAKQYHFEAVNDIMWEQCSLRSWLNTDFIASAFSKSETDLILTTDVDNSNAQGYSGWRDDSGNITKDQVFLLSYAEANRYLDLTIDVEDNQKPMTAATDYAIQNGASISTMRETVEGKPTCWWWLRSPGASDKHAADVGGVDAGTLGNAYVDQTNGCVRPALWMKLNP